MDSRLRGNDDFLRALRCLGVDLAHDIYRKTLFGFVALFLGIWSCASPSQPGTPESDETVPAIFATRERTQGFETPLHEEHFSIPAFVQDRPSSYETPAPSAADTFLGLLHRDGLSKHHLNISYDRSKSGDQILFETKCSKCHPLSRPLGKHKSIDEWDRTTLRMRAKFPVWISEEERKSIVYYLTKIRGLRQPKEMPMEQAVFEKKCSRCHSIDRPLYALKPLEEWPKIVERMREKAPLWITGEEAATITHYLVENIKARKAGLHQTGEISSEQALFEKKCSRCHVLDRPLMVEDFSSKDWIRTVNRMREKVPDWISEEEAGTIIFFLIKANSAKKIKKESGGSVPHNN